MRLVVTVLTRLLSTLVFLGSYCVASAQQISWTPTFENIGIEVLLSSPSAMDAQISVSYREEQVGSTYRLGHALSRISGTRFAGSLLGLTPGRAYSVRLESSLFSEAQSFVVHTRSESIPAAQGTVFHVSPGAGSDSNVGTSLGQAFRTIAKALTSVQAGDKVLLHDGVYFEGDLFVWRSGTESSPIVIENAEGATPIIDGTDPSFTPQWETFDSENHLYRAPCTVQPDKGYLDGGHLFRYQNLEDLRSLRWSQPSGFYVDGVHLYARFPLNGAPAAHTLTLPRFTTALTFEQQSHWQVRGLVFRYFGFGAFHRGIYIDGGDHITIDRCQFRHNVIGVALKRAADFNLIQHCSFTDFPIDTWNWHAVKSGGVGYEGGGVFVYTSNSPNRGNVVRNNHFQTLFDGAHLYSASNDGPTCDFDFYDNVVEDCLDDAVETDGGGVNCRIYGNTFRSFLTGVSVAPAFSGPTYIVRNLFRDWHSVAEFTGYPIKFNVSSAFQTQFVFLYHNTCHTSIAGQNGFLFKNYSNWIDIVSRNNIYSGTDHALESQSSVNPVDFNFDNLFTTHPGRFARWLGVDHQNLAAFQQGSGQEDRGLSVDPIFVDPSNDDFTLGESSALLDAGIRIQGINDGFRGAAPDIGAFER